MSSSPPTPPTPPPPPGPPRSPYAPPSSGGPPGPHPPEGGPRLPWEERDRLGIVEALIQTIRLLVTDPGDAFSRLRRDGDLTSPILFGVLLSWVSVLLSQIWNLVLGNVYRSLFQGIEGFEAAFAEPSAIELVLTLVLSPIAIVIFLFVFGAVYHVCLMLVGATETSPTGFEGTLKTYAYAQVSGLAAILPIFGGLIYVLWALVLEVIGFAAVHRTSQGRALVAVLIPVVLCCLCMIVIVVFFGAILGAMFAGMAETMAP